MRLRSIAIALGLSTSAAFSAGPDRVTLPFGQKIFVSGINVAWDRFGGDVGTQPLDTAWFSKMLQAVSDSGGNAVRWWLFTNCSNSPTFDPSTKLVNGLGSATVPNIRSMLDMAYRRGIVVSLCLLSFDMMKISQGVDTLANQKLLLTDAGRTAFLDNALVPLAKAIGHHPAILDWEIFNEPEGMVKSIAGDWGNMSGLGVVQISDVQKMVNQAAGAIHRAVPGVLVSNGSWAFIASSNTLPGEHNHYSDSALKAVGGDPDGTLDFYMVHYYEWAARTHSPFHHAASYWGLDKPIVIGEFPAKGLSDSLGPLSPAQCFQRLYDSGYAGAMGWTYTAHDGFGGLPEDGQGTRFLRTNHATDVVVDFPPTASDDWWSDTAGKTLSVAAPGVLANDLEPTPGQTVTAGIVVVAPIGGTVQLHSDGSFTYTPASGFAGTDSFSYQVVGGGGAMDTGRVRIRVVDPSQWFQAPPRAKDWTAYASWGTYSVTDTLGVLAVHNSQWGSSTEWVVGTGVPLQATGSALAIRVEVLPDPASPWIGLKFHLAQSSQLDSRYGPADSTARIAPLALQGDAGAGWQIWTGSLPAATGSYLPSLEFVWNGSPSTAHTTLWRDLEVSTGTTTIRTSPTSTSRIARILGHHLALNSGENGTVVFQTLEGRVVENRAFGTGSTEMEVPASTGMLLVRVRRAGQPETSLLALPHSR
jgi:hypothetical protein